MKPMDSHSYRRLFSVPGFRWITASLVIGRLGEMALTLVLVLFVLEKFHSPALAGLASFFLLAPGKVVSPLSGAVLDRLPRRLVISADYLIEALLIGLLVVIDIRGALSPTLLCIIMLFVGIFEPIGEFGMRSLFPQVVPRHLWDRANAVDSTAFVVGSLFGPAAAGVVVAWLGADWGMGAIACVFLAAALATRNVTEPTAPRSSPQPLLRSAMGGLRYVLSNPTLRGLAIVISILNLSTGAVLVGVPVLLVQHLNQNAAITGLAWAFYGLAGLISALIFGRDNSEGRERSLLGMGQFIMGSGYLLLIPSGPLLLVILAMAVAGTGNGPTDIALFALRQRRTDPEIMGRAMAISMSLNGAGLPIGGALAGIILAENYTPAVWLLSATAVAIGTALIPLVIPRDPDRAPEADAAAPES